MKEKINASAIPDAYLLCMNQDCPKATDCLRRIAEQQIGDEVRLWRVISPKYQKNQTGDCPYFRPSGKHYDDSFGYSGNHKWDHYSAS